MKFTSAEDFYGQLWNAISGAGSKPFYVNYDERHDYDALVRAICGINRYLAGASRRHCVVAVYSEKNFAAYAAIYASILSGNTWMPVNPSIPAARVADMFRLSKPDLILFDRPLPDDVAEVAAELGADAIDLNVAAAGEGAPLTLPPFEDDEIAYIMFTSGSTGVPKGVPMTHENYFAFIGNALTIMQFEQNEVFSDYHDFGFDISIFYLFCAPLAGGAIAPAVREADRLLPLKHIRENAVTVLSSVPSIVARIRALHREGPVETTIRKLFLCGEPFRLDILEYCQDVLSVPRIFNFYGLTETGVENFWHECGPKDRELYADQGYVPIGRPLPGNDIRLANSGELFVSGRQLMPGYLGGVGTDRFETREAVRWFATGDKVIQAHDVYFCKGRLDSQVKVAGYRIELMDIEAHIRAIDGIDEAVCFVAGEAGREFIVGAIHGAQGMGLAEINADLAEKLPKFMLPATVFYLSEVPLNKSGKIDRVAIRGMYKDTAGL